MAKKFCVLLIGSGGREYAFLRKLLQSSGVVVSVAPGSTGMLGFLNEDERARVTLYPKVGPTNLKAICELAKQIKPDLAVVGPESPLILGLQKLLSKICPVFGFDKIGAKLEGSKIFAKKVYEKLGLPTAPGTYVRNIYHGIEVLKRLQRQGRFVVLKCDTEAAGKGVIISDPKDPNYWDEMEKQLWLMMDPKKPLGFLAKAVVIEERYQILDEWSAMSLVGPNNWWLPLMPTLDHKPFNGVNTGGMGVVTPAPGFSMADMKKRQSIVQTIFNYLKDTYGEELCGVLYEGLNRMGLIDYLVEINCRGGDPETQVQLEYLLGAHFHEVLLAATEGNTSILSEVETPKNLTLVGVVMASKGYPGDYSAQKGKEIIFPELSENVIIFPAGLAWENDKFLISGGRVGMVVGKSTLEDPVAAQKEAGDLAYTVVHAIDHGGALVWKDDIGEIAECAA